MEPRCRRARRASRVADLRRVWVRECKALGVRFVERRCGGYILCVSGATVTGTFRTCAYSTNIAVQLASVPRGSLPCMRPTTMTMRKRTSHRCRCQNPGLEAGCSRCLSVPAAVDAAAGDCPSEHCLLAIGDLRAVSMSAAGWGNVPQTSHGGNDGGTASIWPKRTSSIPSYSCPKYANRSWSDSISLSYSSCMSGGNTRGSVSVIKTWARSPPPPACIRATFRDRRSLLGYNCCARVEGCLSNTRNDVHRAGSWSAPATKTMDVWYTTRRNA